MDIVEIHIAKVILIAPVVPRVPIAEHMPDEPVLISGLTGIMAIDKTDHTDLSQISGEVDITIGGTVITENFVIDPVQEEKRTEVIWIPKVQNEEEIRKVGLDLVKEQTEETVDYLNSLGDRDHREENHKDRDDQNSTDHQRVHDDPTILDNIVNHLILDDSNHHTGEVIYHDDPDDPTAEGVYTIKDVHVTAFVFYFDY